VTLRKSTHQLGALAEAGTHFRVREFGFGLRQHPRQCDGERKEGGGLSRSRRRQLLPDKIVCAPKITAHATSLEIRFTLRPTKC
jgi:hypothetical protein